MDYIGETVQVLKSEIDSANHKPFIRIRGELIPLLFESELLGNSDIKDENYVVILKAGDTKVGFMVDEFVGQLDVVQKPLSGVLANHQFLSGVSLLGNGDVLFVLDIKKILSN
jgi:two-component system chemotaxis sensor kinase CheA